jgi:hypothetical protein
MLVPLAEVIVNAGLTRQALLRAKGMPGSWGSVVAETLKDQMVDFKWLM